MSKIRIMFILISLIIINNYANAQDCLGYPEFVKKLGFDPNKSAFSSSERKSMGLSLIEIDGPNQKTSSRGREYRHPSWDDAGYLGAITRDRQGNGYVAPKANVNMLYNPREDQNTLYIIDHATGEMSKYIALPIEKLPNNQNPYGIMGSFYDCDNDEIILSTICGSDQKNEIGKIYVLDIATKSYRILLDNTDVIGLGIINDNGQRLLIYSKARNSEIWAQKLDPKNRKIGQPYLFLSLEGLGPRGDDKARRIRMDRNQLVMYGTPFFYNLTAPVQVQETVYRFTYDADSQSWKVQPF